MRKALVICPSSPGRFDGVGDYSHWLTAYLQRHLKTSLATTQEVNEEILADASVLSTGDLPKVCSMSGWHGLWRSRGSSPFFESEAVLLQYVPQLYFPRRELKWCLLWLAYAKLRQRKRIILTVHEYNVPLSASIKRIAARVLFDFVITYLAILSNSIVVTHGFNHRKLRRLLFWKRGRIFMIPVGSNIACVPNSAEGRNELIGQAHIVTTKMNVGYAPQESRKKQGRNLLTLFGQPSAMDQELLGALGRWMLDRQPDVRVQWIGRSRDEILETWCYRCGLPEELLDIHEGQSATTVSCLLQGADIFLAPLLDGVSTRRTTIMAALGHGLPVIGTRGACTDSLLYQDAGILLSDPGDKRAFVGNIEVLLSNVTQRETMKRSARELFTRCFTWERIAADYWELIKHNHSSESLPGLQHSI